MKTRVDGIFAGNCTLEAGTGCTVIVCPEGATGGVDVRGGAPASRETDLLRPEETADMVHAIVLSGGSAFGLTAASGVAEELERRGIGFDVVGNIVPIVPAACVFDLPCGDPSVRPGIAEGVAAVVDALDNTEELSQGNYGAGTGCTVGKIKGVECAMKSGLGIQTVESGPLACQAFTAVNALGDVVDPNTGAMLAGVLASAGSIEFASTEKLMTDMTATMPLDQNKRANTTISCIVTNARLTKAQATKVAQMAADAYAHAIRPTHTTNDGDTIFVLAKGEVDAPLDVVGVVATQALERAIANACTESQTAYGYTGLASINK